MLTLQRYLVVLTLLVSLVGCAPAAEQDAPAPQPTQQRAEPEHVAPEPLPQPTVQQQAPQVQQQAVTVYVTNTGKKYHRDGCRYLSRSKIPMELTRAKAGYEACKVCKPPG